LRQLIRPVELDNNGTIQGSNQDFPILASMRQRLGIKSVSLQDPAWFRPREIAKISKDLRTLRKITDAESVPSQQLRALKIEQIDPLLPQTKEVSPLLARAWEMRTMLKGFLTISCPLMFLHWIAALTALGLMISLGPSFGQSLLNLIKNEDQVDYLHATTLKRKFQYVKLVFEKLFKKKPI